MRRDQAPAAPSTAADTDRPACTRDPRRVNAGYDTCGPEAEPWLDAHLQPPIAGLDDGADVGDLADVGPDPYAPV